jgi:hypothetical protein
MYIERGGSEHHNGNQLTISLPLTFKSRIRRRKDHLRIGD